MLLRGIGFLRSCKIQTFNGMLLDLASVTDGRARIHAGQAKLVGTYLP